MTTVRINVEELTLGDMERLEAGRVTDMLAVFDRHLEIEGVAPEDVPATIREWTLADLKEISETIAGQVKAQTDPVRKGKN
jgi:hypothetical protein